MASPSPSRGRCPLGSGRGRVEASVADRDIELSSSEAWTPSTFVRVDLTRLDELMRNVGDLSSACGLSDTLSATVGARIPPETGGDPGERHATVGSSVLRRGIHAEFRSAVGEISRRCRSVVRDFMARARGSACRLELQGQGTRFDKF